MQIPYEIKRSARRTLSVEIRGDGSILVRAPQRYPKYKIDAFLAQKEAWILSKLHKIQDQKEQAAEITPLTEAQRELYRQKAREVLAERTARYSRILDVTYNRIAVRDQKTRWGSCSSKGNLNYNWRLILAPAGVLDYVVVHELAHRKEMNHSARFWQIVGEVIPDYAKYRKWLRENGALLQKM